MRVGPSVPRHFTLFISSVISILPRQISTNGPVFSTSVGGCRRQQVSVFVVQMQRRFFVLQSTAAAALRVKANQNGTDCVGISDEFPLVSMCANKTLMPLIVIKRTQVGYCSDLRPIYRRTAAFQLCLSLLRHDSTGS